MKYFVLFSIVIIQVLSAQVWNEANNGIYGGPVVDFTEFNGSYYLSTNGGIYQTDSDFEDYRNILVNGEKPRVEDVLFFNDKMWVCTSSGLSISTDNGETWTQEGGVFQNSWVNYLIENNGNLFAGVSGHGIYFSSDNGINWMPKNEGLNEFYPIQMLLDGENIYLATNFDFYISYDYGEKWESIVDLFGELYIYSFFKIEDTILISSSEGLYSYDVTTEEVKIYQDNDDFHFNDFIYVNDVLYGATNNQGILKSFDMGYSWEALGNAEFNHSIHHFIMDDSRIVVASSVGMFISEDNANSWTEMNHGLTNSSARSIVRKDGKMYAAVSNEIYVSENNAEIWEKIPNTNITSTIYKMSIQGDLMFALGYEKLFRSSDNGNTWFGDAEGLPNTLYLQLFQIEDKLYLSTWDGIFVSDDYGDTWANNFIGTPVEKVSSLYEYNNTLYAGTWNGLYISDDYGESWTLKGDSNAVVVAVFANDEIIAYADYSQVFISEDNGSTWKIDNTNFLDKTMFNFVYDGASLLVSTSKGVYATKDKENWFSVNEGLNNLSTYEISYNDQEGGGGYFYAATNGGGIYKVNRNDLLYLSVKDDYSELDIYPNPAEDYIEINLDRWSPFLKWSPSEISIYNMLGERVFAESIHPMTSSHQMNVANLPRGMYFIRIGDRIEKFVKK